MTSAASRSDLALAITEAAMPEYIHSTIFSESSPRDSSRISFHEVYRLASNLGGNLGENRGENRGSRSSRGAAKVEVKGRGFSPHNGILLE